MRLICPSCGAMHSAEAWENDAATRGIMPAIAALPQPVSERALPYLALFREPASKRGLAWRKARRLVGELAALAAEGWIQRDRKPARPITAEIWGRAMERLVERPPRRLPLTSHGYLASIAYDLADEADRAAETRRNQAERSGRFREPCGVSGEPERIDPEEMRRITERNFRRKRKRTGGSEDE